MANPALLRARAERKRSDACGERPRQWMGKTVNQKVYKQVPVLPEHRDLVLVFQHDEKDQLEFFLCNSLLFGLRAHLSSSL